MITLLIILGIIVVPPIFNVVYTFVTVKFNLWNEISELIICDGKSNHKIDKYDIIWLIAPFLSCICFIAIFSIILAVIICKLAKILLYPFIKTYEFIIDGLINYFNKIEDKREFFNKINNH